MHWLAYGVLWATAALVNAAVLSVLPFLFLWLIWKAKPGSKNISMRFPSAALAAFVMLLLPWSIRNHHVLGGWVPLRSNFGLELWLGNNPGASTLNSFAQHPFIDSREAETFQRIGEISYTSRKRHDALAYIRSHPYKTLRSIIGRIGLTWFAITDRPGARWSALPLYLKILFAANFCMIAFSALGLTLALRKSVFDAFPYLLIILVFPVPYYFTHTLVRYRFPMEPVLAVLSVYGLARAFVWARDQRWSIAASAIRS